MRRIKEKAARLRRYPRGRGFGVQSPNDYNFITKVVKGRLDADCCSAANKECSDLRCDNFKFVHLCYRVAQYLNPSYCMCLVPKDENVRSYVVRAVPDVELLDEMSDKPAEGRSLVILSPAEKYLMDTNELLNKTTENMWMIIDGIRKTEETYRLWQHITEDMRTRITFDLYHYGIICFDKKRYKQNYKIYL